MLVSIACLQGAVCCIYSSIHTRLHTQLHCSSSIVRKAAPQDDLGGSDPQVRPNSSSSAASPHMSPDHQSVSLLPIVVAYFLFSEVRHSVQPAAFYSLSCCLLLCAGDALLPFLSKHWTTAAAAAGIFPFPYADHTRHRWTADGVCSCCWQAGHKPYPTGHGHHHMRMVAIAANNSWRVQQAIECSHESSAA